MADCINCKYAVLDCEEYYNTTDKQWFVEGCKKDMPDADCCSEFEEWEEDDGQMVMGDLRRFWEA